MLIASTEQPGRRSGLIEKVKVAKNQVREKAKANRECFVDMSKTGMRRNTRAFYIGKMLRYSRPYFH